MTRLILLLIALVCFMTLLSACKVEKRIHRPGYHVEWVKKKPTTQASQNTRKEYNESSQSVETNNEPAELAVASNHSLKEILANLIKEKFTTITRQVAEPNVQSDRSTRGAKETASDNDWLRQCETLVFQDGRRILIFVVEIGEEEIRYKRCDDPRGEVHAILRKDVLRIEYPDGTHQQIEPEEKEAADSEDENQKPGRKELETLAVGAFSISLLLLLGVVSLWLAIVSLRRFRAQPGRFRGMGFAIAALVISLVTVVLLIWLIAVSI